MTHPPDPYTILSIPTTASPTEIRAAWRRKAVEFHPDKNPDRDTTRQFQEVQAAWEILRDPTRRAEYDAAWMRRAREHEGRRRAKSEQGGTARGFAEEAEGRKEDAAGDSRRRDRRRTYGQQDGERFRNSNETTSGEHVRGHARAASDTSHLHPEHAQTRLRSRRSSSNSHPNPPTSPPISIPELRAKLHILHASLSALQKELELLRSEDADWEFQTSVSNRQRENSIGSARNVFRKGRLRRELDDAELAQRAERERRTEMYKEKEMELERVRGKVGRLEEEVRLREEQGGREKDASEQMRERETRGAREEDKRTAETVYAGDEDDNISRWRNSPEPDNGALLGAANIDMALGIAAGVAAMATFPELTIVALGVVLMWVWLAWTKLKQIYSC